MGRYAEDAGGIQRQIGERRKGPFLKTCDELVGCSVRVLLLSCYSETEDRPPSPPSK